MIQRINELIGRGESFAFETTCSGRAHAQTLLQLYLPLVDIAYIYDNTDEAGILIAERQPGQPLVVCDDRRWRRILRASRD